VKNDDRPAFATIVLGAAEVYGQEITDSALELWWSVLESFTIEQISKATHLHLASSKFMPRPADLVTLIQGSATDRAQAAWHKVLGAIRSHGSYRSIAFDDALVVPTVERIGGWIWLCEQTTKSLSYIGKDFTSVYEAYHARPPGPGPRHLAGRIESLDNTGAYTLGQVVLIGDRDKAHAALHAEALPDARTLPAPQA